MYDFVSVFASIPVLSKIESLPLLGYYGIHGKQPDKGLTT
jgi:hypothetical protein